MSTFADEVLATTYDVYQAASGLARREYGMRALTADEGGLAPPFSGPEEMLPEEASMATMTVMKPSSRRMRRSLSSASSVAPTLDPST